MPANHEYRLWLVRRLRECRRCCTDRTDTYSNWNQGIAYGLVYAAWHGGWIGERHGTKLSDWIVGWTRRTA
jgi:hypothetical protein